jgi:hypothetical protein
MGNGARVVFHERYLLGVSILRVYRGIFYIATRGNSEVRELPLQISGWADEKIAN